MKLLKLSLVVFGTVGLMVLAACSNTPQETNSTESTAPKTEESETTAKSTPATTSSETAAKENDHPSQGGQVIESGPYHLELVTLPESGGTHLDFYLQDGDKHEAIPDAKVTGQVQLPNGEQKPLNFTYDAKGKHYAAFLPDKASGEYKVVIQSDIKGKKVNGRFSLNK
jgi:plastocyanin